MNVYSKIALLVSAFGIFLSASPYVRGQHTPAALELHNGWVLEGPNVDVLPARVPGYVHQSLLDAQIITDLNDERNNKWSEHDYVYRLSDFGLPAGWRAYPELELVFEGIDTFAEVLLNGQTLVNCDNYFRTWRVKVNDLLNDVGNVIEVKIKSPYTAGKERLEQQAHPLPGEPIRAVARKPQYHYGWDWAPTITPMGIHGAVRLEAHYGMRLEGSELRTLSLDGGNAIVEFNGVLHMATNDLVTLSLLLDSGTGAQRFGADIVLHPRADGRHEVNHRFEIEQARLWWPHDLGQPILYDVAVEIARGDGVICATRFKAGIRTIELVTVPDTYGETFAFAINGVPQFMRGANYVPPSLFERTVTDHEVLNVLNDALKVHMNMIRVWGGGVYERDAFYDWCDEHGVLVWQDFMYACAMYPGDDAFVTNARREAEEQVLRLRRHASIALWCGNNEVSEGWRRWGWQEGLSDLEQKAIEQSYRKLFNQTLTHVVEAHTSAAYWESSPRYGRGDERYLSSGDAHDWGVWHDGQPFEHYLENVPRFMSEFGFQSMPDIQTIRDTWQLSQADTSHAEVRRYQKHPRGFAIMDTYMKRSYREARDFEDWSYLSQLVQRDGIVLGIRAQRGSRPACMGSLYWQLNDCWPGVSWSSIDGARRWKALHYALDAAFSPASLFLITIDDKLLMYSTKDIIGRVNIPYKLNIFDFNGQALTDELTGMHTAIKAVQGSNPWLSERKGFSEYLSGEAVVVLEWEHRGAVHRQAVFSKPLRDIDLPVAHPYIQVLEATPSLVRLLVTSDVFASNVCLSTAASGNFNTNYFDLPAGWSQEVIFMPGNPSESPEFELRCLNCD